MGRFLRHEPCPECGSRDNLAIYDDGSAFCFGCRYTRRRTMLPHHEPEEKQSFVSYVYSSKLPQVALEWLAKWGLLNRTEYWKWAPAQERLCYEQDGFVIGRRFGNTGPKWVSYGSKPLTLFGEFAKMYNKIYLVEDIVSAMVVAKYAASIPLYGTYIIEPVKHYILSTPVPVVLWLDRDKAKDALQIASRLQQLHDNVSVVITERDPKYYDKLPV